MTGKAVSRLSERTLTVYKKITGNEELKCAKCGRKLNVGDRIVKHGKLREPEKKGFAKHWRWKTFLYFECEDCWMKKLYDFEEPTEEEIERGEILTVPFLNLEEVKLKW